MRTVSSNPRGALDHTVWVEQYAGVPHLEEPLEVQFIEVRHDRRGQGVGAEVLSLINDLYPGRRLVAFAKRADGFYEARGWSRHVHADPEEVRFFSPL